MRSASFVVAVIGMVLVFAACGGGGGSGTQDQDAPAGNAEPTGGTEHQGKNDAGENESDNDSSHSITGDGGSVSQSNKVSGGSSASSSSQTSSGGGVKSFSGQGASNLTFNVERPSRLSWTNDEDESFSARGGGINISSRSGRGEIDLKPRRYEDVRVRGATWTITVRPR
jgi:hypothetical protein